MSDLRRGLFLGLLVLLLAPLCVAPSVARAQEEAEEEDWGDEEWDEAEEAEEAEEEEPEVRDEDEEGRPEAEPESSEEAEEAAEEAEESEAAAEEQESRSEAEAEESDEEGQADEMGESAGTTYYGAQPRPEPRDDDFQLVVPPVLYQRQGGVETIATFPLFYLRQGQGSSELAIPPYYNRRGEDEDVDVVFPLFWWWRGENHQTWLVPPIYAHEAPDGFDFGIAPLFMFGEHQDGEDNRRFYNLVPPFLYFDWGDSHERYTFGPLFYRVQEGESTHWGIPPLFFAEETENSAYFIQPPFFFRFEDRIDNVTDTVIPPFYLHEEEDESYWGIAGLLHHNQGEGFTSTTIPPLAFHYSEDANSMRLVTPLFGYVREGEDETLVTWLYQRYRGATRMDAVAPFFFWVRDPREHSWSLSLPPFFFHFEDPAAVTTAVVPFFLRHEERGRSSTWVTPLVANHLDIEHGDETTWVLPTLQISRWHDGDAVNFHPIWYYESVPSHRHIVLAPVFFDFENFEEDTRYTVLAPFFVRVHEQNTTSTLVLNFYHRERHTESRSEWEFHVLPFFSYGESSDGGHWWKVLFGLAGYERHGIYGRTTLFYYTWQSDGPEQSGD